MNVFEAVKKNITARQAAEWYGFKVIRNGMMKCPFHKDKTPSMKIDRRYYCFGCLAGGDVIDFVSNLYGLGKRDAALKLSEDFGIDYEKDWTGNHKKAGSRKMITKPLELRFKQIADYFWEVMTDYYFLLLKWRAEYDPADMEGEPDPRYVEAVMNITTLEYVLDTFLEGDLETRVDIINDYGRKLKDYERRLKESATGEAGGAGTDNECGGEKQKRNQDIGTGEAA